MKRSVTISSEMVRIKGDKRSNPSPSALSGNPAAAVFRRCPVPSLWLWKAWPHDSGSRHCIQSFSQFQYGKVGRPVALAQKGNLRKVEMQPEPGPGEEARTKGGTWPLFCFWHWLCFSPSFGSPAFSSLGDPPWLLHSFLISQFWLPKETTDYVPSNGTVKYLFYFEYVNIHFQIRRSILESGIKSPFVFSVLDSDHQLKHKCIYQLLQSQVLW